MKTDSENKNSVQDHLTFLLRLQEIHRQIRTDAGSAEEYEHEVTSLRSRLPQELRFISDTRLAQGKKVIMPANQGKCGSCYLSVPSGDYSDMLSGSIKSCHYCEILLYADQSEIAERRAQWETRKAAS